MKKILIIILFFVPVSQLCSQTEWHYFTFSFFTYPVFLNERTGFHSDEYTLIKTENNQNENLQLVDGGGFLDLINLRYSDVYADSTIILDIINVFGECIDTMKLIFNPREMKERYYLIENIFLENIAFKPGVFKIYFPESLVDWQKVKTEPEYFPKFKEKCIYHKNIASLQEWYNIGQQWLKEEYDASEKRYNTFDQHIGFRIYDTLWNAINPGSIFYNVSWSVSIEWDQPISLEWSKQFLYDSTNKLYVITYHDEMWEHDEIILIVKGKKDNMQISFRSRLLKQKKCSTAEVFIDSIKYKPGKFEVTIPNKVYWNDIKTFNFIGYDKEFYDLTLFQKWRD